MDDKNGAQKPKRYKRDVGIFIAIGIILMAVVVILDLCGVF